MSNTLPENDSRRTIALQYLGMSARDVIASRGDLDAAVKAVRVMKHYIDLARRYGCTDKEIQFALGMSDAKWQGIQ